MKCRNVLCIYYDDDFTNRCGNPFIETSETYVKSCDKRIAFNRIMKYKKYHQDAGKRFLEYVEKMK